MRRLNWDELGSEDSPESEDSGIQFIPMPGLPESGMAFTLFEDADNQILKTPFGLIKISIHATGPMQGLAEEIKTMFSSGVSPAGLAKLNQIIEASPQVRAVLKQIPGLKNFLAVLGQAIEVTEEGAMGWQPGPLTMARLVRASDTRN
ncbi:MAG: hypothetical protein KDB07_01440 [Planctomycetes bacterium]|nr:hypothetical protein [Planctomycetota bacterium]